MTGVILSNVHESRRKPLARCVASIFALAAPTATLAATVTSCLDDLGPGTLRKVIEVAAEGGTVDFAGLTCVNSKITLSGSSIPITRNSLTIDGTGAPSQLTIDASALPRSYADSRIFTHSGAGTLTIDNLVLTDGYVYHRYFPSFGGCLSSSGSVVLNSVTVTKCITDNYGTSYTPIGGAISVSGDLTLNSSTVSYSSANGVTSAQGGGVSVTGDLKLTNSTITQNNAKAGTGVVGGGAYAKGDLTLDSSTISYNTATTNTGNGLGGGAYVGGNLTISNAGKYSFIEKNSVSSNTGAAKGGGAFTVGDFDSENKGVIIYNSASAPGGLAAGGGLHVGGALTLKTSFLSFNTTDGPVSLGGGGYSLGSSSISYTSIKYNKASGGAYGGGLNLKGTANTIASSTISNNTADGNVGGVDAFAGGSGVSFELKNSTISNNQAGGLVGGMYVDAANVKLWNSTIAFNTAGSASHSPGAELSASSNAMSASLQSTLISNNSVGSYQLDLSTYPNASSVTFNGGLPVPANNLIRATLVTNLPPDTKHDCPHLGALRDNGGLAFTHALMSNSPAIDAGNDSSLLALYDQRGSAAVNGEANYTRFSGLTALTDIGAHEVQKTDIVFNTDFEDCPSLAF